MPKLMFLVTEDGYFWSHRLPMARAARDAGFSVSVLTQVSSFRDRIEAEGFRVLPLEIARGIANPFRDLATIARIVRAYRSERPDIVHHVALKPTLYGSIAAILAGVPGRVNAMAGLGFVFISDGIIARVLRPIVGTLMRISLSRGRSVLLLQNKDDAWDFLEQRLISPERIRILRGSGVDLHRFVPLPEPEFGPISIGIVCRMLRDKGVETLFHAHQLLRKRGYDVSLLLAGNPDPMNPATIDERTLRIWAEHPGVEWLGHCTDVRDVWARSHIACLPSRREGLPLSLLEAAACGRPIVTTDVPGCREIVVEDNNGYLVPFNAPDLLADRLERLIKDADLRRRMGAQSRRIVEADMSTESIQRGIVEIYQELLMQPDADVLP